MARKKFGLIVNPFAGLGGKVGLKGSDGEEIQRRARELGAEPIAPVRAVEALLELSSFKEDIELVTYPYSMGEEEARECGFDPVVVGSIAKNRTTATDTKNAAKEMAKLKVDIIIFAGGDGTARDICEAIDQKLPVLGIPSGVKMHSGVFAANPKKAAELSVRFLKGKATLREAEVMDIDEKAFRKDKVSAVLCGFLRIPYEASLVQQAKCGSPTVEDEKKSQEIIAEYVVDQMDDSYYILCPGTTVKAVADRLGIKKTLLGVDVVQMGTMVAADVNERQLLKLIEKKKAKIVVTPIGGQGYIFGRGNQQISSRVLQHVGRDNVIVIATRSKLSSVGIGCPLMVDIDDEQVGKMLSGYMKVIVGYNEEVVVKVVV